MIEARIEEIVHLVAGVQSLDQVEGARTLSHTVLYLSVAKRVDRLAGAGDWHPPVSDPGHLQMRYGGQSLQRFRWHIVGIVDLVAEIDLILGVGTVDLVEEVWIRVPKRVPSTSSVERQTGTVVAMFDRCKGGREKESV